MKRDKNGNFNLQREDKVQGKMRMQQNKGKRGELNWEHSRGQTGKDRRGYYTVLDTAMKETVCT